MRYSLNNFYQSKEWEVCRLSVMDARTDSRGVIICEHCGKPIIKKYDCIGHHRKPLTENNVNDFTVSLNPDNISLVHMRCHNEVHNKLGAISRSVWLVYGPPLSGKTEYVHSVMEPGSLIVDMDNIWKCISGCDRYIKPDRLKAIAFHVRDILIEDIKIRRGKWKDAYLIGGYPLAGERERLARALGAREIFMKCSREECLLRLEKAGDGRNRADWKKYIEEWFRLYSPRLCEKDTSKGTVEGMVNFTEN